MKFKETKLKGAYLIVPEFLKDERGFFARSFCKREFRAKGLNPDIVQGNISHNSKKHVLRGMHYQASPGSEEKMVRCTRGSMYDVIIDLRPGSPTYCKWSSFLLTADNFHILYIPKGMAHGFLTLEDRTDVLYLMSEFFNPALARGVRWDDPAFKIRWPAKKVIISEKDRNYEDFKP